MAAKQNRFIIGDILDVVKFWDQCDNEIKSGIVEITDYTPNTKHTRYGLYETNNIRGNLGWMAINAQYLDDSIYVVWLGNINTDKVLRVLYGTK